MTIETPRRAGRKALLTRESIVAAAMRLIERQGYDALTIRNVAAELGVKSASLYWHFPTKEALVDRLADEVLADLKQGQPSRDWRRDLREGSLRLFRYLLSKRDAARLRAGRLLTGPHSLRLMESGLGVFRRAGLKPRDAAFASHAVHVYVVGFVIFAVSPLSAIEADGASPEQALSVARTTLASLPAAEFPNLVELAGPLTEGSRDERFLFGLDCLIAGIAHWVGGARDDRRAVEDSSA